MKKYRTILFLYILLLVILSSCAQINRSEVIGVWELISFGSPSNMISSIKANDTSIEFTSDGSLSGNVGCNSFSGNYKLDGESITFDPLVATLMFCMGPVGDQEAHVFSVLQERVSYKLDADDLMIVSGDGFRSILLRRK